MINTLGSFGHQEMLDASPVGEQNKTMGSSFFRGEHCNFVPYGQDHCNLDFAGNFILKGWAPEKPIIAEKTKVTAFGSCFAENIGNHLAKIGFDTAKQREKNIYVSYMGEGLVNVHAIAEQFKWALDGCVPRSNLWHGYKAEEFDPSEDIRVKTKEVFLNTDVFILTFGLSEIWYDEVTGGVFWRAVPMKHYDASRHKFRVSTFLETKWCISEIIKLINHHVPQAKIVMTVSPIPLITTFRPISCITANSVSKSLIRAALDETIRELSAEVRQSVFYFPAFELVNECFPNRFIDDGRHLHPMIVPSIMRLFEATFCHTNLTLDEAERSFREARLENARTLAQHPLFSSSVPPPLAPPPRADKGNRV
ncbi:GSCFA domain-containing protein [uncultured Rhodoblastus sp.]|uniref:GSCFA domain-containing protein n=1 Tax=uncultured Rhodoblastus sp. TaxID=543037 RepID=UPI0025E11F05|nr:GSCFA domain-containing protein [uncultured Rhodoblastus sp.]